MNTPNQRAFSFLTLLSLVEEDQKMTVNKTTAEKAEFEIPNFLILR